MYWGYNTANLFTIGTWFRSPAPTAAAPKNGSGPLVGFASAKPTTTDLPGNHDRMLYIDSAGRIVFGLYPGAVRTLVTPASIDYRDGQRHHVAASLSPAGMVLYVDGQRITSRTDTTKGEQYNGYWRIGCQSLSTWPNAAGSYSWAYSDYYTGEMQYAFGYYTALSDAEIHAMWLAGQP